MDYEYLLLGPQKAGKSTLGKAVSHNDNDQYSQTSGVTGKVWTFDFRELFHKGEDGRDVIKTIFSFGISKKNLFEVGGSGDRANTVKEHINNAEKILFIFNGIDYIEELKHPEKGGLINAMIRSDIWNSNEDVRQKVFFVANFANEYNNGNMRQDIIQLMQEANNNYRGIGYTMRYPYTDFFSDAARFFCADLRKIDQVRRIFRDIINTGL